MKGSVLRQDFFRNIKDREYEINHPSNKIKDGSYLNDLICKSTHSFIQHLPSLYYVQSTVLVPGDNVSTTTVTLLEGAKRPRMGKGSNFY